MNRVSFDGAAEVLADSLRCNECRAIPAAYDVDVSGKGFFIIAFKPSREDMEAFARGEPVYVKVCSGSLPKMFMFTMNSNNEANI